jgi:hypothetical protein
MTIHVKIVVCNFILAKCLLYKYSVRRRDHVLFTLFVFVCVQWRPTHIMWCFCFCIASFSGLSILIAPSVFSNVYFYYINLEIVRLYILSMNLHCNTNIVNKVVFTTMTWQYSIDTQKLNAHRLCLWPFMLKLSYVTSFTSITWNPLYFNVRIKWEKEEKSHCRKNSTTPLINRLQRHHWYNVHYIVDLWRIHVLCLYLCS